MGLNTDKDDWLSAERETALRGLAFELKNPLIKIARQAELGEVQDLLDIRQTAEQTLMLIDSYLLSAQSEYGQTLLDLSPVNIGSVLYDASSLLRRESQQRNVSFTIEDKTHEPVMTHRPALISVLAVFGRTLMNLKQDNTHMQVVLKGYKTRQGTLVAGMFSNLCLTAEDIKLALSLQGKAHMPMASTSAEIHGSLSVADKLCRAVGGQMKVKRQGKLCGLTTELPRSEQLSLV